MMDEVKKKWFDSNFKDIFSFVCFLIAFTGFRGSPSRDHTLLSRWEGLVW